MAEYATDKYGKQIAAGDRLWAKLANCTATNYIVMGVSPDGVITAYPMTTELLRTALPHHMIQPTKDNKLPAVGTVLLAQPYNMSHDFPFVRMSSLPQSDVSLLRQAAQQLPEVNPVPAQAPAEHSSTRQIEQEKVKEKIKSLCDSFQADPDKYVEYLKFRRHFYNYSCRNSLLIYMQNPYATFVASPTAYRKWGISVLPDQIGHGMTIFRPNNVQLFNRNGISVAVSRANNREREMIATGKIQTYTKKSFRPEEVYEIAQTDCPRSRYPALVNIGQPDATAAELYQQLKQLAINTGVSVEEKNLKSVALGGYYSPKSNTIAINAVAGDTKKLTVMAHEYARAMLHRTSNAATEIKEFEAESLAILLQSRLGVEPADGDISYLKEYFDRCNQNPTFDMSASIGRLNRQLLFITEKMQLKKEINYTQESAPDREQAEAAAHKAEHEKLLVLPVESYNVNFLENM